VPRARPDPTRTEQGRTGDQGLLADAHAEAALLAALLLQAALAVDAVVLGERVPAVHICGSAQLLFVHTVGMCAWALQTPRSAIVKIEVYIIRLHAPLGMQRLCSTVHCVHATSVCHNLLKTWSDPRRQCAS